jgi:hypothetical protein
VRTPFTESLGVAMTGFLLGEGGGEVGGPAGGGGSASGGSSGPSPSPTPIAAPGGKAGLPPPKTKILGIATTGTATEIRFKGSGGYGKLTFRCHLGAAKKSVACTSPLVEHHLAAGKHRFSVDAVDSHGVADPSPAHTTFTTK